MKGGIRSEEEGLQLLLGELIGLLHAGAAITDGCGNQPTFAVLEGKHLVLNGACSKRCLPSHGMQNASWQAGLCRDPCTDAEGGCSLPKACELAGLA